MQLLEEQYRNTNTLHHAYILEGALVPVVDALQAFCTTTIGVSPKGNPDFFFEQYDTFVIDNARRLRELQQHKTLANSKKIFIVAFHFITREAQNALLKVLEEPTAGTHIFIVTPSAHIFLPTVLSRVALIRTPYARAHDDVSVFLKGTYKKRMDYITALVKNIKDEKASKAEACALVHGIVTTLHANAKTPDDFKKLREINDIAQYLEDTSASVKMLLEHVALVV